MLRIYRGSALWKTYGCLWTAANTSIRALTDRPCVPHGSAVHASALKKTRSTLYMVYWSVVPTSRHTIYSVSLSTHLETRRKIPDLPRPALLRNAARVVIVAPSEARPTHHKSYLQHSLWVKVGSRRYHIHLLNQNATQSLSRPRNIVPPKISPLLTPENTQKTPQSKSCPVPLQTRRTLALPAHYTQAAHEQQTNNILKIRETPAASRPIAA